jgi:hypothetical protein
MTSAVPLKSWIAVVGSTIGTFMAIINVQIVNASLERRARKRNRKGIPKESEV